MKKPEVIAFAGLPLTGKSTLSKLLGEKTGIPVIDVDEVRQNLFKDCLVDSETNLEEDERQMAVSWNFLFALIEDRLKKGNPVIIAGTFSRQKYHQQITAVIEKHDVPLKVIFCHAPERVIGERIELRKNDKNNASCLKSIEGYNRTRLRYQKISVQNILDVDTSRPVEQCLEQIITFLG